MTHHKKSSGYTEALRCLPSHAGINRFRYQRNMFPEPFCQARAAVNFCQNIKKSCQIPVIRQHGHLHSVLPVYVQRSAPVYYLLNFSDFPAYHRNAFNNSFRRSYIYLGFISCISLSLSASGIFFSLAVRVKL
jgi:hypothetical protein